MSWEDKASGARPREASVYVEWTSWFVTRVGQTKHRAQGLAMQVTAPFGRVGQTKPRAQGLATQVTTPTLMSRSRQRSWADNASGARPRDASDCANFNEQVKTASWADKASGARPRDASDCANRASKSGLARLRQH